MSLAPRSQVLKMEAPVQSTAQYFARSNLAALRHEDGDIEGAVQEYRNILG